MQRRLRFLPLVEMTRIFLYEAKIPGHPNVLLRFMKSRCHPDLRRDLGGSSMAAAFKISPYVEMTAIIDSVYN